MTVADDLATLRDDHIDTGIALGHIDNSECLPACVVCAALDRVEAEIARLTDAASESKSGLVTRLMQRAEAAEAEAARLRDGLRAAKWAINLGVGCARDLGDDQRLAALIEAEGTARALLAEDGAA